jgi:hypothetical protein
VVRPDEDPGGAPEARMQEHPATGMVDWAKVSENFDRHQGLGAPAPAGAVRQPPLEQPRHIDLDAGREAPNGTEAPAASRSAVSASQARRDPPARQAAERPAQLLARAEVDGFRGRWPEIKASFVDSPRSSVQQADALVNEITQLLVRRLTEERSRLEAEWSRGEVTTEDLRQSLHRYQVFFDRITLV